MTATASLGASSSSAAFHRSAVLHCGLAMNSGDRLLVGSETSFTRPSLTQSKLVRTPPLEIDVRRRCPGWKARMVIGSYQGPVVEPATPTGGASPGRATSRANL